MQCCEPIVTWLCLNIVNRLFALCFFMVIDLRLKNLEGVAELPLMKASEN